MNDLNGLAGRIAGAAAALLLAAPGARADIGLAARFGEVVLEGAKPGKSYSLREASRLPFAVQNRGDAPAEIVVESLIPGRGDLSKGYEAVPDPGWLKAVPERMTIPAKGLGYFDLILTLPEDAALEGRHFQATVRARMAGSGPLALAIENKVRVSVGPGPAGLAAEKKAKAMARLDFDVKPRELYLAGVAAGRPFDSRRAQKKAVRAANYGDEALELAFTAAAWEPGAELPEGYEPLPDPAWVRLSPSPLKVKGGAIGQASVVVDIPDEARHRGKKYAVLIRTGLSSGYWLDAPVRVFVETRP